VGESIIWSEHAMMKDDPIEQRMHALLFYLSLASAVLMVISVYTPKHVAPFVGSLLCLVWRGLWLCTVGHDDGAGYPFDREHVASFFVLEGLLLASITMMVLVLLHLKRNRRLVEPHDYSCVGTDDTSTEENSNFEDDRAAVSLELA